jgi:hypothetical protein
VAHFQTNFLRRRETADTAQSAKIQNPDNQRNAQKLDPFVDYLECWALEFEHSSIGGTRYAPRLNAQALELEPKRQLWINFTSTWCPDAGVQSTSHSDPMPHWIELCPNFSKTVAHQARKEPRQLSGFGRLSNSRLMIDGIVIQSTKRNDAIAWFFRRVNRQTAIS